MDFTIINVKHILHQLPRFIKYSFEKDGGVNHASKKGHSEGQI